MDSEALDMGLTWLGEMVAYCRVSPSLVRRSRSVVPGARIPLTIEEMCLWLSSFGSTIAPATLGRLERAENKRGPGIEIQCSLIDSQSLVRPNGTVFDYNDWTSVLTCRVPLFLDVESLDSRAIAPWLRHEQSDISHDSLLKAGGESWDGLTEDLTNVLSGTPTKIDSDFLVAIAYSLWRITDKFYSPFYVFIELKKWQDTYSVDVPKPLNFEQKKSEFMPIATNPKHGMITSSGHQRGLIMVAKKDSTAGKLLSDLVGSNVDRILIASGITGDRLRQLQDGDRPTWKELTFLGSALYEAGKDPEPYIVRWGNLR